MRCISLWQPWASLLVAGKKRFETRSWPARFSGPLLIHAAKKWNGELALQCAVPAFARALKEIGFDISADEAKARKGWDMPFGAVVGQVFVWDVVPTARVTFGLPDDPLRQTGQGMDRGWEAPATEQAFGDYGPDRYAWVCHDPVVFRKPIPFRGGQGFFDVPDALVRDARATGVRPDAE